MTFDVPSMRMFVAVVLALVVLWISRAVLSASKPSNEQEDLYGERGLIVKVEACLLD